MKETPKTQQQVSLVKKKTEKLQEKKCIRLESFFFRSKFLFRENHTTEEENFVVREISLQTNKQHKRGQTKERREQNARKSWPPLSPPLRFWCVPFRRRQSRLVEEGGGGAKEAPIIIR